MERVSVFCLRMRRWSRVASVAGVRGFEGTGGEGLNWHRTGGFYKILAAWLERRRWTNDRTKIRLWTCFFLCIT
jgi:hypothetical protein